jgi:hypothetical protein
VNFSKGLRLRKLLNSFIVHVFHSLRAVAIPITSINLFSYQTRQFSSFLSSLLIVVSGGEETGEKKRTS